jgi:adenine deaminase
MVAVLGLGGGEQLGEDALDRQSLPYGLRPFGEEAALGVTFPAPFQMLAFLALSVIPALKITDRGLVDVDRFELVPLEVS